MSGLGCNTDGVPSSEAAVDTAEAVAACREVGRRCRGEKVEGRAWERPSGGRSCSLSMTAVAAGEEEETAREGDSIQMRNRVGVTLTVVKAVAEVTEMAVQ